MSDVKRYEVTESYGLGDMREDAQGGWVRYDDYALLKAEVERLQSIHSIDSIGIEQLKAEVERLTADLNKMTKTPEGVDYVEVDVGFWTKSGSRLPSSYSTFWSNAKEGKQS